MYDVTIIGAGVIGCAASRELAKYKLKICVLEKETDVANGTTKANSGIVHAGEDPEPGSLKAQLNVRGNSMFDKLSKELDFPFKRNGSLVLCFSKGDIKALEAYKARGEKNGVPNMKILTKEEALQLEPNLSNNVEAALYLPSGGIVCPYEMTIALAENAYDNGVEFKFETEVRDIKKENEVFNIITNTGEIKTKLVINAAGVFADEINNLVSSEKINIIPRKGQYCLFDKTAGVEIKRTLFQLPTKMGKGVLVTPTVDGNLLVGPNATDEKDKNSLKTSREALEFVLAKGRESIKEIPMRQLITSFSGLRAHLEIGDFVIEEAKDAENFINAVGIESPGLTSAPAIAEMLENIVMAKLKPEKRKDFNPIRRGIPRFREMSNEERKEIIKKDHKYGKIICRCEMVTEGEIVNAIKRPIGAVTLDGVKRRTRAGMGRCQAGFCTPRILEILSRELKLSPTKITKFGGKSNILLCRNKENI